MIDQRRIIAADGGGSLILRGQNVVSNIADVGGVFCPDAPGHIFAKDVVGNFLFMILR